MLYRCNNCDFETDDPCAVNPEIPDFWARVESGDLCPEGTCRQCGAFVHRYDDEFLMKMAAPDLLAACRAALADLEGIMPEFEPSGDKSHPAWKTINELNSAIAKATGEDILNGMPDVTPKGTSEEPRLLIIETCDGEVKNVQHLPEGWDYEVHDFAEDPDDIDTSYQIPLDELAIFGRPA